jgi:ABC-type nickel/cobalt efflux system permease component RcnA
MLVAGGAFMLGKTIDAQLEGMLETGVGAMLMLLGATVLFRLWRDRVHFHMHRHADGVMHFHAHSHTPGEAHDASAHAHAHPKGLPYRTLLVGMVHGMAGSAALLVLTASSVVEPALALVYIALFGFGSVVGMALLSAVIAVPISYAAKSLTWGYRVIQVGTGVGTFVLGGLIVFG